MPIVEAATIANVIASVALIVSALSVIYARHSVRNANQQFEQSQRSASDALVAANYLALETASSEIFKYTAQNEKRIAPLRGSVENEIWSQAKYVEERGILLNLYYQSLNLFEVCARFRRDNFVKPEVFASWVAWMVEVMEDDFFRASWNEIRTNYTRDVRDIFDVGVQIFERVPEGERNPAIYAAIADIMTDERTKLPCAVIAKWLTNMKVAEWTPPTT